MNNTKLVKSHEFKYVRILQRPAGKYVTQLTMLQLETLGQQYHIYSALPHLDQIFMDWTWRQPAPLHTSSFKTSDTKRHNLH